MPLVKGFLARSSSVELVVEAMANQEHLDHLRQGTRTWNRWRQENPDIKPDLSSANLSSADLSSANLSYANLSYGYLISANLRSTNLSYANLSYGYLRSADLRSTNLSYANLKSADLRSANLSYANLKSADLSSANLSSADLSSADLNSANLVSANLSAVQALQANFKAATLTGACIEDWNINSATDLQEVICEHIFTKEHTFTKYDSKQTKYTDRRPHDSNQIFAPGEFTKRYQIILESVDLFFNDGIDWKAFLASLH